MKKSEVLKPKRKIKFKCFLLASILTLFFTVAHFSFAADNSFNFNAGNGYDQPFSKLIDFLNEKKKELEKMEKYDSDFLGAKIFSNDIVSADEINPNVPSFASAVLQSVKGFVVDSPKQYLGTVFESVKSFIFPRKSQNNFEYNPPNNEESAKEIEALKSQYEEAINEASALSQKFILLQNELGKIKNSGIVVKQPVIEQKVVERTIERIVSGSSAASSLSQSDLDSKISEIRTEINNLNTNLTNQINNLSVQTNRQTAATYQTISLTNKIDSLSGTKLSNITVSGVSGLTDSDIPDGITASSYLPLAGGTLTGSLTGTALSLSGQLTVSGTATSTLAGDTNFDSGTLYIDSINNRVGIASSSPSETLSLNGPAYLSQISTPSVTTDRLYNTSGDLYWNGNLVGSASVGNWTSAGGNVYRSSGNVGIGTTSPYAKLSVVGQTVSSYFTATTSTASTFPYASSTALTVSGTASTTNLIVSNTSTLGTISSGLWNGTALSDAYISSATAWNNKWDLASSTIPVSKGGTGQTSFGQGWLNSDGTTITSSTSPTVNYIVATSTTATSTLTDLNFPINSNLFYGGQRFLTASTTAAGNLTIGYQTPTGIDANGGTGNTGLGYQALGNATSTSQNVAIGYQALKGSATVSNAGSNVAIGYKALTSITSGSGVGIGSNALASLTTGVNNAGIGISALVSLSTGSSNMAMGNSALGGLTSGSNNVTVGAFGLQFVTTSSGNTAIGNLSGRGAVGASSDWRSVTDSNMTFIGYQASRDATIASTTALTNGTAIGYNARVAQSNAMVLGGTGSDAVNVGIGTTSPWAKLSIQNTYGSQQTLFDIASSTSAAYATSSVFRINAAGNIDIGTWNGTAVSAQYGGTGINSSALTGIAQIVSGVWSASSTLAVAYGGTGWNAIQSGYVLFGNGSAAIATSSSFYWDNGNSRLGIGTTTPDSKLTVFASADDSAIEFSSASGPTYKWTMGMDYSDAGKFKIASSTALGSIDRFTIDGNGYVGIGTSTPGRRLDVADSGTNIPQLRLSRESNIYTDFSVAQTTGDLSLNLNGANANNVSLYAQGNTGANLWVCEGAACPSLTLTDGGNIVVERDIKYPTSGRMKRTVVLTAAGAIIPTSGGATKTQVDGANSSYYVLDFGQTATTSAFWQWTIPDSYDGGSISATYYWFTTVTSGGVSWCSQTNGVNTAEDINAALSNASCDTTSNNVPTGSANTLATTTQSSLSSNFTPGEAVTFKVSRGVDNTNDTAAANARLYMIKLKYGVATESD